MHKFIYFILFLVLLQPVKAQQNGELGPFIGVAYYMGEINQTKLFYAPSIAYGLNYRHVTNERYAVTFQGIRTVLQGNDTDFDSKYQQTRNHSFQTEIIELSLQLEFNFLPLIKGSKYEFITPYLAAGGGMIIGEFPGGGFQFAIPFGIGIKASPTERLTISAEWKMRKTFTDYIDRLADDNIESATDPFSAKQRSYITNKDWYAFAGVTLSFQLFKPDFSCPAYRK